MLKAVLFDFDGLILDTETPEVEVLRQVFAEHGETLPEEYWTHAFGRGADQIAEKPMQLMARLCGRELDVPSLELEQRRRTVELIHEQPIRPGVVSLLEQIRGAGLKYGIASSSRHDWVEGHLDRLGLLPWFSTIVCADDVLRAKPYPDLYLLLMSKLAISAEECFALEDSPNGIRAAKDAGLFVIAVQNPLSARLDLSAADRVFPSLDGLSLSDLQP
jgi:HAD superfamily hydrolase (TIGR01509 family)